MKATIGGLKAALITGLVSIAMAGCADRPHSYGEERPPVDQLAEGNSGLQAKDVVSSTDQMAADLLAVPELNASQKQWTIVVTNVENKTTDPRFSYDAFTERLRVKLSKQGHGRVALIENRDTYKNLQNKELEQGSDEMGQGGGRVQPGPVGQNPDFALRATVIEMPNRATSYYMVTFYLTNLSTRVQVWTNDYEVQTAR